MASTALLISGMYSRLKLIQTALAEVGWQVETFQNPQDALDSLKSSEYGAVYCDEQLRGASAGGLLIWTRRLAPDMPFYLFSDSSDLSRLRLPSEPTGVLSYPPEVKHLPRPEGTPVPEVNAQTGSTPLSGNTSLIALSDILDMMGVAGQSSLINLDFGDKGQIYVNKGVLEHAVSKSDGQVVNGLPALATLILLEDCNFQVEPYVAPKRNTVNLPASNAMTEAARLADEQMRYQNLMKVVRKACPKVTAIATGYPLSSTPSQSIGDAQPLFERAKVLLDTNREALGTKVTEFCVATEAVAFALVTFGEGNILVATAPAGVKLKLFAALRQAVKSEMV